MRLVGVILFATNLASAGGETAEGVLKRVAEVYRHTIQYTIRVRTREIGELGAAAFVGSVPETSILLVRSGRMFRYEYHTPAQEGVWLTDGITEWHWRRDLREYIEESASWPKQEGPGIGLPGVEWAYFAKFRAVQSAVAFARLVRDDAPPDKECPEPAVLIEIALAQSPSREYERLWIGGRTYLVYKSLLTRSGVYHGTAERLERRTVWDYKTLDEQIDPKLFEFKPPKGSKRVSSFRGQSAADPKPW